LTPARDRERISALTAGLAATIIIWTFAAAYAPATLEALGEYSPWLYGPISTAAWAVFSALAYLLIHRSGYQRSSHQLEENYRGRDLGIQSPASGHSVCANRDEKNHLGAVTAGFALTITAWVAALSLMPSGWLDALSAEPPWSYCLGSVGFWAAMSTAMYAIFSSSDRRRYQRQASLSKLAPHP
jgi:hypothetical protein